MKTTIALLACLVFLTGIVSGFAQTATVMPSIPTWWGHSWGIGARDMGMGGAATAVGGDYSALYYNPAGLGTIQRKEMYGTLSRLSASNEANFLGQYNTENTALMGMNSVGFSFPLPTARGSMVFSFGYNRVRQFDNTLFATAFISTPRDSVDWNNSQTTKGWMSNTALGGAVEVSPGIFLGGSLQFWGGKNDFTWLFQEMDPFNLFTFSQFDSTDHILTTFSGVNLSLGGLFKSNHLSIGGTLSTPYVLKCSEDWNYRDVTTWDKDIGTPADVVSDQGKFEYKISIPMSFRAGAALTFGPVLVSGDVEIVNFNQMEYTTDPSIESLDKTMANLAIQRNLRNTINYRFGGELSIPNSPAKLRAGYALIQTPFKNLSYEKDRKVLSFGAGYAFSERIVLDVGYAKTDWTGAPDNLIFWDTVKSSQILASVSFRL